MRFLLVLRQGRSISAALTLIAVVGCSAGADPSTSSSGTGSTSGAGGDGGGSDEGGAAGTGGAGGGPAVDCTNPLDQVGCSCSAAGELRACYSAEPGTANQGSCQDGTQTCVQDGEFFAWGPCTGDVVPADEDCGGTQDLNCNGLVGCADSVCVGLPGCCTPNETRPCYDGPAGTDGVGVCHGGTQICDLNGAWLSCMGQALPGSEPGHCADQLDNDCDGKKDCQEFVCLFDAACQPDACTGGETQPCYDGPVGTSGVGPCHGGTKTCAADGSAWGPCVGQVIPGSEGGQCADSIDNDCNGAIDCGDLGCVAATQCCVQSPGSVDGTIWANSPSTLYRIDPSTFAVTTVGTFNHGDQMTDVAVTPAGELYGVSFTSLYHVNKTTGAATFVADLSGGGNNALTFLPSGNLLAADSNGDVKLVNPTNGTVTAVGNFGGGLGSSGDLVATGGGVMYGTTPGDKLVRVSTANGVATIVGPIGKSEVWGLAYANAHVIGLTTGGQLLNIDPQSGMSTVLASTGIAFWGAGQSPLVVDNACP